MTNVILTHHCWFLTWRHSRHFWQILDKHTIIDKFCSKWTLIASRISAFHFDATMLWEIHSCKIKRVYIFQHYNNIQETTCTNILEAIKSSPWQIGLTFQGCSSKCLHIWKWDFKWHWHILWDCPVDRKNYTYLCIIRTTRESHYKKRHFDRTLNP